jgi:hypothetical protein
MLERHAERGYAPHSQSSVPGRFRWCLLEDHKTGVPEIHLSPCTSSADRSGSTTSFPTRPCPDMLSSPSPHRGFQPVGRGKSGAERAFQQPSPKDSLSPLTWRKSSKNSSATSRKLNVSRSRHKTARRTMVVGNSRVVEGGASSFIERSSTVRAEKRPIPEFGLLRALLVGRCSTMRAVHQLQPPCSIVF